MIRDVRLGGKANPNVVGKEIRPTRVVCHVAGSNS